MKKPRKGGPTPKRAKRKPAKHVATPEFEPRVEVTPKELPADDPLRVVYECPRGHRQLGPLETTWKDRFGEASSVAVCVRCQLADWHERYPTAPAADQAGAKPLEQPRPDIEAAAAELMQEPPPPEVQACGHSPGCLCQVGASDEPTP